MTFDVVIKDILRDIEKLKEVNTACLTLNEISTLSIPATVDIAIEERANNVETLTVTCAPALSSTAQDASTFVVGTARVGFCDCA